VCLRGVPKKIVSDRGTQFTTCFWQKLHKSMDTKLNFSSAYHPQTDGQTERTNQILEDMLRACALKYGGSWDKSCHMRNSLITTSIKQVLTWPILKLYMEESAGHRCTGVRQEKVNSSNQRL
jgi:hypothetical protein